MRRPTFLDVAALALSSALGASCLNPAHTDEVDALGGETNGVRRGPEHRPGQPCLTCHGPYGPGSPEFSVAGTVYATRASTVGQAGVIVIVEDARNERRTFETNRAGNFYVEKSAWDPIIPLRTAVDPGDGTPRTVMETLANGTGSCGQCHRDDGDEAHAPRVYVRP